MKGRHHLEWHRFRKNRSPDRRRRRDRLEDVGIRVAGTIGPAGTTLVDLLDGSFVQDPPLMELSNRDFTLTEVVIHLTNSTRHNLFETGQLVLEVLQSIMKDIDLGVLLSDHLTKVATLTKS